FVYGDVSHPALPSCPTRRSSDLIGGVHSIAEDRDGRIWLASSVVLLGLAAGGQVQHRLEAGTAGGLSSGPVGGLALAPDGSLWVDRKSTRLNSSHVKISYAVFCL